MIKITPRQVKVPGDDARKSPHDEEIAKAVYRYKAVVITGAVAAGFSFIQFIFKAFSYISEPYTTGKNDRSGFQISVLDVIPISIAFGCGAASHSLIGSIQTRLNHLKPNLRP